MKVIRYQKMIKMEPREGNSYATVYVKQTMEQRMEMIKHIRMCINEIADVIDQDSVMAHYIEVPQKGFRKTSGSNRSIKEIMTDMINEARGHTRRGDPKDFALAPIERWNKLFKGTDYAIDLVQTYDSGTNNFNDIMELTNVSS